MRPANKATLRLQGPRGQRGVTAVFAALSLVTLLSAVGLAIDVGSLFYSNRDLQRLADLAAIDGSRVQSQCLGAAGTAEVMAEVDASLKRNKVPPGVTVITRLGARQDGDDGLRYFKPAGANDAVDSVQVTLSRRSPARILPLFAGDQTRTLTTRAAAKAEWVAAASVGPPRGTSASGNFAPAFLDSALSGTPSGGRSGNTAGASVSLSVADLVNVNGEVSTTLPDLQVPTAVLGLLSQVEALLNQSGDAAAASAVNAYASIVAAGRPGATVVPAEVLGLPARGAYDGASTTVGDLLNAIAGSVSNGDAIQLPDICALIKLDDLPTAQILPAFCDSSITLRVPQPSRAGVFNSNSSTNSTDSSSDDAAVSAGGFAVVRVGFINPIDGKPLALPVRAAVEQARATVTGLECARLGQPQNVATVSASGPRVTFAIGDSNTFTQSFATPGAEPAGALDDVGPASLLSATVQQVLATAGVNPSILGNSLNRAFLSQPVTISVRAGPVVVGNGRRETFCMQGPPFATAEQCNGAPATIGGTSSREAAERIADALSEVDVTVQTPQGLPPPLQAALEAASATLRQTVADRLKPAVRLASQQLVPVLESANLVVGESYVYLNSAEAKQPRIYAQ